MADQFWNFDFPRSDSIPMLRRVVLYNHYDICTTLSGTCSIYNSRNFSHHCHWDTCGLTRAWTKKDQHFFFENNFPSGGRPPISEWGF